MFVQYRKKLPRARKSDTEKMLIKYNGVYILKIVLSFFKFQTWWISEIFRELNEKLFILTHLLLLLLHHLRHCINHRHSIQCYI